MITTAGSLKSTESIQIDKEVSFFGKSQRIKKVSKSADAKTFCLFHIQSNNYDD